MHKADRNTDHAANITAAERAKQYRSSEVYEDGGKLFCRSCNIVLSHQRKSTVDNHMKSANHLRHAGEPDAKKQKTIDTTLNVATVAAEARVSSCNDWLSMLVSANIPISKSDHPKVREFLRTRVQNGGSIPKSDQLTEHYLPDLYECEKRKLKAAFVNCSGICIVVDETSDEQGRFVLNVLFSKLQENSASNTEIDVSNNTCYLADTLFLDQTNNVTVSQSVIKVVTDYCIDFNKIRIFCTDNAAYMLKAFRDTLSVIFPNCVHITCFAHLMNLVCEAFRRPFKDVHQFVIKFKKLFAQPGQRKARYLKHLRDSTCSSDKPVSITLPPDPVATRWNSWYEAVAYHYNHVDVYRSFFSSEKLLVGDSASDALNWLNNKFNREIDVEIMKVKLAFINTKSVPLLTLLASFESRIPSVLQVFDKLEDLRILLETNCQCPRESFEEFFALAVGIDNDSRVSITSEFLEAFQLAADKVQKYIEGSQPGIHFVKACRILKPQNTVLLSKKKQDYSAIPGMTDIPDDEFLKYIDVIAPEVIRNSSQDNPVDVATFWKSVAERLPCLSQIAQMYIYSLTTSADVERSFSKYNQLLTPQRTRLSEGTLRMLEFLYWNLNHLNVF